MTIDELKRFVEFVAKKQQSGSNPTPSEFNLAVARAFIEWVMGRYGNPANYVPGKPIPAVAWEVTQKISDDLGFLLERHTFRLDGSGRMTKPDGVTIRNIDSIVVPDYLHLSSIRSLYSRITPSGALETREVPVNVLRDHEIGGVLSSAIVTPTDRFPSCSFIGDTIQFYPSTVQRVVMGYLRTPKVPVWAFTVGANGRAVFDAANSVDVESPDITHNEIAMQTLSYLGISIREPQLTQYAEVMKKQEE